MKKVFISLPMAGKTSKEIKESISKVSVKVSKHLNETIIVLDSFFENTEAPENVNDSLWFLSQSLQVLSEADVAFFADGWEDARGCRIEHLCANAYNIPIIEEEYI